MNPSRIANAALAPAGTMAKRAFWEVEPESPEVNSRPMSSEERLLAATLIKTIQDYKGVSTDHDEECVECHSQKHPSCFHEYERNGKPYLLRTNKQCRDFHTYQQCAADWISSDAHDIGKERTGWTFIALCEVLGIEPTYLRRSLADQSASAYWKDEAKIHSFLGFHTGHEPRPTWEEASHNTGLPDQEGKSD